MLKSQPLSGLSILIVEDAFLIALEAQHVVEEAGAARVLLAGKIDDVQNILATERKIDVCVLDLKLGDADASSLIQEIADRQIALLLATGFDSAEPKLDVPLLRKPYEGADLVEAIRAAYRNR